jgi:hypothetical protein
MIVCFKLGMQLGFIALILTADKRLIATVMLSNCHSFDLSVNFLFYLSLQRKSLNLGLVLGLALLLIRSGYGHFGAVISRVDPLRWLFPDPSWQVLLGLNQLHALQT